MKYLLKPGAASGPIDDNARVRKQIAHMEGQIASLTARVAELEAIRERGTIAITGKKAKAA